MSVLWIVRHGLAGSKERWRPTDDRYRPLSRSGIVQAQRLTDWFASRARSITAVCTSPTVRCASTVLAVAEARGLDLRLDARLAVGDPAGALALAESVLETSTPAGGAVLCTHGEVMGPLLASLVPDCFTGADRRCAKGALWELVAGPDGERRARYVVPGPEAAGPEAAGPDG
ncbi:MAG: histidine phosphatase family protein [Acidimicrobiales bacterium]